MSSLVNLIAYIPEGRVALNNANVIFKSEQNANEIQNVVNEVHASNLYLCFSLTFVIFHKIYFMYSFALVNMLLSAVIPATYSTHLVWVRSYWFTLYPVGDCYVIVIFTGEEL